MLGSRLPHVLSALELLTVWLKGARLALGKGQSRKHEQSWRSVIIESWMCSQPRSATLMSISVEV